MARQTRRLDELELGTDGAQLFPAFASEHLGWLSDVFARLPRSPGYRFTNTDDLQAIVGSNSLLCRLATELIGTSARPVRAIAFNKSDASNWALGWHQDRTIHVKERATLEGYGPWTTKHGLTHVEPPFSIMEQMLTVRIHLDPVDDLNAPLRIALGSHKCGKVSAENIDKSIANFTEATCLANAGDVWVYLTPILHASHRSSLGTNRRVLQVDFSATSLPQPLQWALSSQ